MSTGLENKIKFNFNQPSFQNQFGGKTGTVSEKRKEQKDNSDNIANIIEASAGGLDSITNFAGLFTGNAPNSQANYTPPPPPPQKKISPFVWIGAGTMVLLLIILLITSKNGQAPIPKT